MSIPFYQQMFHYPPVVFGPPQFKILDPDDRIDLPLNEDLDPNSPSKFLGFVRYFFKHALDARTASMTFIAVDQPGIGPRTTNYCLDIGSKIVSDWVPVLFSDGRWDFGSGLDYMTIKNQEQMFGYWFYQNGSPTPQNPLNMTREQFDARYRLNEQEEEEEPDDDIEVEISSTQQSVATGEDPILAYAEQISSKKFPGTLVKEFRADKLTDGTFLTELNWTALRHTLRYDSLNKFDNMPPSVFATLPEGISFTTVEILTFFPGCINDAFFAYRVVAVGWTPAGLTNAFVKHRTHTDTYDALRERIQRRLRSGLRLVTEDDRIALDVYSKLPISRRSIVEDYSSNTFATTYAARNGFTREFKKDVPRADDVKLSQLLEAAGTLPVGDDAGTLTRLVNALKKGDVDDMKMSQVANFMLHNPNYEVQHNAEKDNMRAAWWNAQEKKG